MAAAYEIMESNENPHEVLPSLSFNIFLLPAHSLIHPFVAWSIVAEKGSLICPIFSAFISVVNLLILLLALACTLSQNHSFSFSYTNTQRLTYSCGKIAPVHICRAETRLNKLLRVSLVFSIHILV